MANAIGVNLDYTYNGQETLDVFITPGVQHPGITDLFTVLNGIKSKMQLGYTNQMAQITKADDLTCGRTATGTGVEILNRTLEVSPLKIFLDHGIKATINTDDPAVEGIELKHEYDIAAPAAGLSLEQIKQAQINGVDIAFLSDADKKSLRERAIPA